MDAEGKVNGVRIKQINAEETCSDGKPMSLTTELTCDKDITTIDVAAVEATFVDQCHFTVAFAHKAGCPVAKEFTDITDKLD